MKSSISLDSEFTKAVVRERSQPNFQIMNDIRIHDTTFFSCKAQHASTNNSALPSAKWSMPKRLQPSEPSTIQKVFKKRIAYVIIAVLNQTMSQARIAAAFKENFGGCLLSRLTINGWLRQPSRRPDRWWCYTIQHLDDAHVQLASYALLDEGDGTKVGRTWRGTY